MTGERYHELLGRLLDGELSPAEARELAGALRVDPQRRQDTRQHLALWEIFSQELARERAAECFLLAWHTRLSSETDAAQFVERTTRRLSEVPIIGPSVEPKDLDGSLPNPSPAFEKSRKSAHAPSSNEALNNWTWRHSLALAACLALLFSLGVWLFGPRMGEPVLAAVAGEVRLERIGQPPAAASANTPLRPGDLLLTASNATAVIEFGTERTRIDLGPETALQLVSSGSGKRFDLRTGRLEAEVARQRPFAPLVVTTPNAAATVIGTRFTLTSTTNRTRLDVTEGKVRLADVVSKNSQTVEVSTGHYAVVADATKLAALPQTGGITREWWTGVEWKRAADCLNDPRFPHRPDGRDRLHQFEIPLMTTNKFGVRMRGYVHPPTTGDYEFWTAAAREGLLFLSADERSTGKEMICYPGNAGVREWDTDTEARRAREEGGTPWSGPIHLEAGRRYYIEAVLVIPAGEGHLSVAWKRPGTGREVLPGEFLSPIATNE